MFSRIVFWILVLGGGVFFLLRPQQLRESFPAEKGYFGSESWLADQRVGQALTDIHVYQGGAERLKWDLWGDDAFQKEGESDWLLEGVRVDFQSNEGALYRVQGDYGRVYLRDSKDPMMESTSQIDISGNVSVKSSIGYSFFTNKVTVDLEQRVLLSSDAVELHSQETDESGELRAFSGSMSLNMETETIYLFQGVRAIKTIPGEDPVHISAQKATLRDVPKYLKFEHDVVIKNPAYRIEGPKARFHYKDGLKALDFIEISDGVKVFSEMQRADSQVVMFDINRDILRLVGQPIVTQGEDQIRGEEIVLSEAGELIEVVRARGHMRNGKK